MSFVADRRLTLFLRQNGVHCGGKLHVPFKAFLQTTSAILRDTNHINGATASKMIRKVLGLDEDAKQEMIFEPIQALSCRNGCLRKISLNHAAYSVIVFLFSSMNIFLVCPETFRNFIHTPNTILYY